MQEKLSIEVVEVKLSPADRLYASHLRAVQAYQLRNPEKIKEKGRKHMLMVSSDISLDIAVSSALPCSSLVSSFSFMIVDRSLNNGVWFMSLSETAHSCFLVRLSGSLRKYLASSSNHTVVSSGPILSRSFLNSILSSLDLSLPMVDDCISWISIMKVKLLLLLQYNM